ncbi:hypothetical protein ACVWZV_002238 [Bradyrhizobium sp. GM5.1]
MDLYKTIKERVTMNDVVSMLALKITKREGPDQVRCPCPSCKRGGDRILSINLTGKGFTCFVDHRASGFRGDQIALVAHVRGVSQREAAEFIAKNCGLDNSAATSPAPTSEEAPKTEDYLDTLRDMILDLETRITALEEAKVVKLRAT